MTSIACAILGVSASKLSAQPPVSLFAGLFKGFANFCRGQNHISLFFRNNMEVLSHLCGWVKSFFYKDVNIVEDLSSLNSESLEWVEHSMISTNPKNKERIMNEPILVDHMFLSEMRGRRLVSLCVDGSLPTRLITFVDRCM